MADATHEISAANTDTIGKLDADRVCQHCLHQLGGATVYRDHRLQLMYVRCTECGVIAAVTEYPMSWRWLRRFGVLIAAVVMLAGVIALAVDVAATTISTYAVSWDATQLFGNELRAAGMAIDSQATW